MSEFKLTQTELDNSLIQAAQTGRTNLCKLLIGKGANPKMAANEGTTALHWACCNGMLNCVKMLINAGADINKANSNGDTAAHLIAATNNSAAVKLLLQRGADFDLPNNNRLTPAMVAARSGNEDAFAAIISQGANRNAADKYGSTIAHACVTSANEAGLKILLKVQGEGRLDLDKQNINGDKPLDLAEVDMLKSLDSEIINNHFHDSIKRAEIVAIDNCILAGANLHGRAENNPFSDSAIAAMASMDDAALEKSASKFNEEGVTKEDVRNIISDILLAREVNIDQIFPDTGQTAIHEAAIANDEKLIENLVGLGANINCQNSLRERPVQLSKSPKAIAKMAWLGADINKDSLIGTVSDPKHLQNYAHSAVEGAVHLAKQDKDFTTGHINTMKLDLMARARCATNWRILAPHTPGMQKGFDEKTR